MKKTIYAVIIAALSLSVHNTTAYAACAFDSAEIHKAVDHSERMTTEEIERWMRDSKAAIEADANQICQIACGGRVAGLNTDTQVATRTEPRLCEWRGGCQDVDTIEMTARFTCRP